MRFYLSKTLFIFILFISRNSHAKCDKNTLLYSGGGRSGLEANEARILQRIENTCTDNIYFGLGEIPGRRNRPRDNISTQRSQKSVFYKGMEKHIQRKDPVVKIHLTGHGGSLGSLSKMKLEESKLKQRAQYQDEESPMLKFDMSKMIADPKTKSFVQITNETCLSGNALAQMIGVPLTYPYNGFDYMLHTTDKGYSKDPNKNNPRAKEINKILRKAEGKTVCGVASAIGHTAILWTVS